MKAQQRHIFCNENASFLCCRWLLDRWLNWRAHQTMHMVPMVLLAYILLFL